MEKRIYIPDKESYQKSMRCLVRKYEITGAVNSSILIIQHPREDNNEMYELYGDIFIDEGIRLKDLELIVIGALYSAASEI